MSLSFHFTIVAKKYSDTYALWTTVRDSIIKNLVKLLELNYVISPNYLSSSFAFAVKGIKVSWSWAGQLTFTDPSRSLRETGRLSLSRVSPRRISPAKFQIAVAVVIVIRRRFVRLSWNDGGSRWVRRDRVESERSEPKESERDRGKLQRPFSTCESRGWDFRPDLRRRAPSSCTARDRLHRLMFIRLSAILFRPAN